MGKRQVRKSAFETNSSSSHAIVTNFETTELNSNVLFSNTNFFEHCNNIESIEDLIKDLIEKVLSEDFKFNYNGYDNSSHYNFSSNEVDLLVKAGYIVNLDDDYEFNDCESYDIKKLLKIKNFSLSYNDDVQIGKIKEDDETVYFKFMNLDDNGYGFDSIFEIVPKSEIESIVLNLQKLLDN